MVLFDLIGPASDLGRDHVRQVRVDGLLHLAVHLRLRVVLQHPHCPRFRRRTVQLRHLHLRTSAFLSRLLELYQVSFGQKGNVLVRLSGKGNRFSIRRLGGVL